MGVLLEIDILCDDIEETLFDKKYDVVMVYNAFPHFPDPKALIHVLSNLVKCGGVISIAHSMSKEMLRYHHRNARNVSIELLDEYELANLLKDDFVIKDIIADDKMYQVTGIKV